MSVQPTSTELVDLVKTEHRARPLRELLDCIGAELGSEGRLRGRSIGQTDTSSCVRCGGRPVGPAGVGRAPGRAFDSDESGRSTTGFRPSALLHRPVRSGA